MGKSTNNQKKHSSQNHPDETKPWDGNIKRLLVQSPQDFITWLLRGARYVSTLSTEFQNLTRYADALFEVEIGGRRLLIHLEFRT